MERRSSLRLVAGLMLAWVALFVYRNGGIVGGQPAYLLLDDAMISMAHARNFVQGHGLSWSRFGPPVEGFTHPLWTLFMIPINALPLALGLRPLLVEALSALALVLNLLAVRSLVLRHFSSQTRQMWLPAVVLTAFYLPLDTWSALGMESGLQALLTTLAIHFALDIARGARRQTVLGAVLAAATLLRMDMILLVALVVPWAVLRAPERRLRDWLPGAALFVAANGAYLLFRHAYYGAWMPNTFYLKMTGIPLVPRIMRGAGVFLPFVAPMVPFMAPLYAVAIARRRDFLILTVPLAFFAYSVWVGGDAWEGQVLANRFTCFVVPLYFVALCGLLNDLPRLPAGVAAGVTAAVLLVWNGLWLGESAAKRWREALAIDHWFENTYTLVRAEQAAQLNKVLPPDALVAVTWAGVSSYFTDFRVVNLGGYNEPSIARKAITLTNDDAMTYRPGHMKTDARWVLDTYRPDVLMSAWKEPGMVVETELKNRGYVPWQSYWALKDSTKLRR